MNAIQQISLKLQMGIAPEVNIQPQRLRAMWLELNNEAGVPIAESGAGNRSASFRPHQAAHPTLSRTS